MLGVLLVVVLLLVVVVCVCVIFWSPEYREGMPCSRWWSQKATSGINCLASHLIWERILLSAHLYIRFSGPLSFEESDVSTCHLVILVLRYLTLCDYVDLNHHVDCNHHATFSLQKKWFRRSNQCFIILLGSQFDLQSKFNCLTKILPPKLCLS